MSFTIPEAVRQEMKQQASAAKMPYATVVGQKVYDLHGLVQVLTDALRAAQGAGDTKKVGEITSKLKHRQAELAAYQAEQGSAGVS